MRLHKDRSKFCNPTEWILTNKVYISAKYIIISMRISEADAWDRCAGCLRITNIVVGASSIIVIVAAVLVGLVTTLFLPECINGSPSGLFGPCDCPVAFSGDGCQFENCVNGYESAGVCVCENKWHGDFCNICNAVNQEKCLGDCLAGSNGTMDSYYGDKCEFYCYIPEPERGECTPEGPSCTNDFTGPNCSFACSDCGLNQQCASVSGSDPRCVCAEEYYNFPHCNVTCQTPAVCPGNVPCTITCSGHGECSQGRCTCSDSEFYVGLQCEHTCPGDPFFSTPCSGHGECKYDSSGAYCQCESGWDTLDDCSCNSEESCGAPTRGTCSAEARGCACNVGYDPATNCNTCDEGYVDDGTGVCVACPGGGTLPVCGGHGTCEFSDGQSVCDCEDNWAGDSCSSCAATAYPKTDAEPAPDLPCEYYCEPSETCNGSPCAADGTCACAANFAGTNCTSCAFGFYPEVGESPCSVECIDEGDAQTCIFGSCNKHGVCECDEGASGENCEINCPTDIPGEVCSGHGDCLYDEALGAYTDSSRIQTCQCDPSYYGDSCNHQPPMFNDVECADNGKVSFLTAGTCSDDDSCDPGFFCNSPLNPYGSLLAETDCDVKNNKCLDVINSADWASFCLLYFQGTQPCPGVGAECARCDDANQLYDVCKGGDISDDPCRHHVEEGSCILDSGCVYDAYVGECRSQRCTDVRAATPAAECRFLSGRDQATYLQCLVNAKLESHSALPASPPVDVLSNEMYTDAAAADVAGLTCVDHTFQYDYSSGSTYRLRCLNGDVTPIKYPSVTRPPGCFVEEIVGVGETLKPQDFNPYVSEYMDCKRAGLTSACGSSTSVVDYSRNYVRTWAHIAGGPVFVQTNTGVVKVVGKVLSAPGAPDRVLTKDYVLLEIFRNATTLVLRIDDEDVAAEPATVLGFSIVDLISPLFVHGRSADSKECAERHDQVADYTDLFIFTGQNVDCSEYDSTDKLAYCMLRTNRPECSASDMSWVTAQPLLTVDNTASCFDALEPWSECSEACMEKVYEPVPCADESGCTDFGASDLFRFCSSQESLAVGRVPNSIATNPECIQGTCIDTLEGVGNDVFETFCDDFLKEEGKCTQLSCDCDAGYGGDRCEVTCPIGNGKTCSGNGECLAPHNHPCTGEDRCATDIFGTCKCFEGSGSACTVECQDCSFAPYTKGQSQRGACNSEFGVCEVLPPGMIFDYEEARADGRTVAAVPFNRDGSLADTSEFSLMSVTDILKQIRLNNCGNGVAADYETEKQGTTSKSKKQLLDAIEAHPAALPYSFIQPPDGWTEQTTLNSWNEISGCYPLPGMAASCTGLTKATCTGDCRWYTIPVSLNTTTATFLSTYTFKRTLEEQDCVAYPMVKKVLQMQGRFSMPSLLEFYTASPNWSVGAATDLSKTLKERVADPERSDVEGYSISIALSAEVTVEDDGEIYNDPVYVIDAMRTDANALGGVLNITVVDDFYEIPISGERSRTFLRGCMDSIFGLERQCNDNNVATAVYYRVEPGSADIDDTVFLHFDKELVFSGIYSGGSGICGLSSELTCPGASTELNVPCSGHGTCARSSCQCTCDITPEKASEPGAILNMQDFLDHSPYRGRGCETTCPGYDGESMDSVCSGRGVCNYRGKCQCEEQYRGDNCEYTCPLLVNADGSESSVCNGHGICEVQTYDLESFRHEKSNKTNYEPADLPLVGEPVKTLVFTFEQKLENLKNEYGNTYDIGDSSIAEYKVHMTCIRLDDDTLQCAGCICDGSNENRRGSWAGAVCSQCASTAWGPRCMSQCPDCGDYGICDFGLSGSGECFCGEPEWGGFVRSPENNFMLRHYKRDNTLYLRQLGSEFEENEFQFKIGSNCRACKDGFDGGANEVGIYRNTCTGRPMPCLMGGEVVALPSTEDECICKNGLFDPENHCCPHGWVVPTDLAAQRDVMEASSFYSLRQLIGLDDAVRICYACSNTDYKGIDDEFGDGSSTDAEKLSLEYDAMRSALAFSATVCDGNILTPCIPVLTEAGGVNPGALCDCPEVNGVQISKATCNDAEFESLLGFCGKGKLWDCGGACGADLECTTCEIGKYMDDSNHRHQECKQCPTGYFTQKVQVSGYAAGFQAFTSFGDVNYVSCPYCAPGWSGSEPGSLNSYTEYHSTVCTQCGPGQEEGEDGNCRLCPAGKFGVPSNDATYNTGNEGGAYVNGEATAFVINGCYSCPTSQYQNELGQVKSLKECKQCPGGKYNDESEQAVCKSCPSGYYVSSTLTACFECPKGRYAYNGGCFDCPAGRYQPQNGQDGCLNCLPGYYSNQVKQISNPCKECPSGFYQGSHGSSYCRGGCNDCTLFNTATRCTSKGPEGGWGDPCPYPCDGCIIRGV